MSKRSEIISQAGLYTFSAQLVQLITLVAAILSRKFLGPAQMGIWATLQIVVEYSKYSTFGMLHGVAREIPYYMGKGKIEIAEEIKNVIFTTILSGSLLIGVGIFLFAFVTREKFMPEVTNGLFLTSGIIVLQRLNDFMVQLLRCYKKFELASSQMISSAIVNAILVAFLTYWFKIYGFIWALGLSFIFNILYIHLHNNFHLRFQFNAKRFKKLVIFGFPIMMIGILTTVLRSVDKIMVVRFLGFDALGFYSIAFMASTYIASFATSIAIVIIPHFQEKFSVTDNPQDLKNFLFKVSDAYALATPAIIGAIWFGAPFAVTVLIPKFIPGIEAMRLLSMSMFFFSLSQPYSDFLITIKKHFLLFPLLAVTSAVALGLNYWVIHRGFGIAGVACATSIAALFNFSIIYFFTARYVANVKCAIQKYLFYLGCGTYLLLALFLVSRFIPPNIYSMKQTTGQLILFVVLYCPLFFLLNHRLHLLPFRAPKK